ncbi:MAG: hypothetical protein OEW02_01935, partial [Myxococcales bacterium]|nr:hypothetical protein [Myxococcales bacterium]MDH5566508.1 hypothetical protein [Myxococcales bacterium]
MLPELGLMPLPVLPGLGFPALPVLPGFVVLAGDLARFTTAPSSSTTSGSALLAEVGAGGSGDASLETGDGAPSSIACSAARRPQFGQAVIVPPKRVLQALHTSMVDASARGSLGCNTLKRNGCRV